MDDGEAPADHAAVPEKLEHLHRRRVRADIVILGSSAQEQVAHATAHEIGLVAVSVETIENLQCVRVDVLARDAMLGPRQDAGFG